VGSCVITPLPSGILVSGVDTATIYFRPTVPTDLIDNLLKDDAPILSCAGGLMIEHPLVKEHVERIDGTEDSVMGLSKDLVLRLLEELSEALKQQPN
jgi:septum formation protein